MELQPPSILAQLPRPLGASSGKTQFGEIYGLAGSKKRKRYEIAAAVDGEAVNIYNVQFPKLVTSYAVPPQSSFACPPCSVRQKSTNSSLVTRQTFCAIQRPEKYIQCFHEESGGPRQKASNISSTSFKLKDSDTGVKFLGIVPALSGSSNQETFDVLVVHENGRVRRLSSDLSSQRWCLQPNNGGLSSDNVDVAAAFLLPFEDARKSIFRRRQDLVATVLGDSPGADADSSSILILISQPHTAKQFLPSDVQVHVFSVPARTPTDEIVISQSKHLRHLTMANLPNLEGQVPVPSQSAEWDIYSSTFGLSLSFETGYINYDMSQYSPQVASYLILEDAHFQSITRVSPRSIIASGQSSIALYNTQYQSVQASLPLTELSFLDSSKSKSPNNAPVVFISHFSKLGILVAVKGTSLLAFDLASINARHGVSLKRPRDGTLLNAIARGIESTGKGSQDTIDSKSVEYMKPLGFTCSGESESWTKLKAQLSALAQENKASQFDRLLKAEILKLPNQSDARSAANHFVEPEKVSFILRSIFSLQNLATGSSRTTLTIQLNAKQTLQWLTNSKHLNSSNIRAAFCEGSGNGRTMIFDGALVEALTRSGSSISLLLQLMRGNSGLSSSELAHALKAILEFARSHSAKSEELSKTLTETPHEAKEPADTVMQETHDALSTENPGAVLADAIECLNRALTRLHSRPQPKVVQALGSILSNSDTLSIIHHLRHSLAMGGYTSRFMEEDIAAPSFPLTLSTIVDLLIACVDAIGPTGWISAAGFAGTEDSEATLIADMKSEISAALAGVEETTYLKGILREFIRYSETAIGSKDNAFSLPAKDDPPAGTTPGSKLKRRERHNGAEILVFDDTGDIETLNGDSKVLLPLSLRKITAAQNGVTEEDEVSKKKVRKATGEVTSRSAREIGYLKRKAVGKYSFERIVL